MLMPLSLLFVGAVLVLNAFWMSGRIDDREIVLINCATAAITATVAVVTLVRAQDIADVRAVAMTLLFSVTYLWVAFNRISASDGRGLGWFSLFVALSVLPEAVLTLQAASNVMEIWLGLCWLAWAALWFLYFLTLAMQRPFRRQAAAATLASGVLTAWLPALFLMYGAQA